MLRGRGRLVALAALLIAVWVCVIATAIVFVLRTRSAPLAQSFLRPTGRVRPPGSAAAPLPVARAEVAVDERGGIEISLIDPATGKAHRVARARGAGAAVVLGPRRIEDFVRTGVRRAPADGPLGPGERVTIEMRSAAAYLVRTLLVDIPAEHPGVLLTRTVYRAEAGDLAPTMIIEHDLEVPLPSATGPGAPLWAFEGGPEVWGEDFIAPVKGGAHRKNDEPALGGVPFIDVWGRQGGIGLGSASLTPRRLTLPVDGPDADPSDRLDPSEGVGARVRIEWPGQTLWRGSDVEVGSTLLVAHEGDFYVGARAYSEAMHALGVPTPPDAPASAHLQHWETYGFGNDWKVSDITSRLPELVENGVGVVTIDSGWYEDFATGDYTPDPRLFPRGDADVRALTDKIHAAGLKAKLWWIPGEVASESHLASLHADWLVRGEGGELAHARVPKGVEQVGRGRLADQAESHDYALCPAVEEVIAFHRRFTRKAIEVWGFDGFKMDSLWGVPPCYAGGHGHASPDDSISAYPKVFAAIAETAHAIKPDALLDVCNCGVAQNFYLYAYQNQPITADPIGGRQVRARTKMLKAFFGPRAPVLADHVELTKIVNLDEEARGGPPDFASCVGVGAILETKYKELASPAERGLYKRWLGLGKELALSQGEYLGELYDYAFDVPEAHAIRKDGAMYYGFYVEPWGAQYSGDVELRGLGVGRWRVERVTDGAPLGVVDGPLAKMRVEFQDAILLRAVATE